MRVSLGYVYLLQPVLSIVQDTELAFKEFIRKYNKVYNSPEEYNTAMSAFAESMRDIEELKADNNITHEVGLNEYSDLPKGDDEISDCGASRVLLEHSSNDTSSENIRLLVDLPDSVDWSAAGALAPVRTQVIRSRDCGCCYAIAATAVMESRFKIQAKLPRVVPMSVQQIVDCSGPQGNHGCSGGQPGYAYKYARMHGMTKASYYPYKAKTGACKTSILGAVPLLPS
ncbi:hypothetical protein FOL47_003606 [Perkinsus chesapeaki]|uniref:Uncharacterized protein n=1 Tax=Perkinsus chesapeaki TaxID=330153 RepID=A0A7J6M7L3_PERCH|nr:hypothetical protein FOL47_003606 [Perkinsus chesapeaki]